LVFSLKGKIKSLIECRTRRIEDLKDRIQNLEKNLPKLLPGSNKMHQKTRRLGSLRQRLSGLEADRKAGRLRICFGGRRLFRAQFNLEQSGYADHQAWQREWRMARSREIFVLGSKDETAGCQGCQLKSLGAGLYSVKLRLPNASGRLAGDRTADRHIRFHASFAYGSEAIDRALASGQAISFRFLRDPKGWRMFVSTEVGPGDSIALSAGMIGVDLNEDHLAVTETDASGNPLSSHRIPLVTYGCSTEQANDRIGVAIGELIRLASAAGKPIACERLDFTRKKRELKDSGVGYARMLSSLSYARILGTLKARAFDRGIVIHEVNPAYTSVIGRKKFTSRYGLSSHGGAALVIARRAQRHTERPNPHGGHGTSRVPDRKRGEHVWSFWAGVLRSERRLQRPAGRLKKAILAVSKDAARTYPAGAGAIPARQSPPEPFGGRLLSHNII
jgi:IS605 OrfB family transposase